MKILSAGTSTIAWIYYNQRLAIKNERAFKRGDSPVIDKQWVSNF